MKSGSFLTTCLCTGSLKDGVGIQFGRHSKPAYWQDSQSAWPLESVLLRPGGFAVFVAPLAALFPRWLVNHRVSQKFIKEAGRRFFHMGSQFECYVKPTLMPYFNWVERRCIYEPGGISGARSIFDDLVAGGIPYRAYSYHHWNDEQILELAQNDLENSDAEFFLSICASSTRNCIRSGHILSGCNPCSLSTK